MKIVCYDRYEFHEPLPSKVRQDLHRFLLDIPYLLYYGVVPSRNAINEVLRLGGGDGGMSPGASWEPFEISDDEYWEVIQLWDEMEIEKEMAEGYFRFDPILFIQDGDMMVIERRMEYLRKSIERYESFYV